MNANKALYWLLLFVLSAILTPKVYGQDICDSRQLSAIQSCATPNETPFNLILPFTNLQNPKFYLLNGEFKESQNNRTATLVGTLVNVEDSNIEFSLDLTFRQRSENNSTTVDNACLPNIDQSGFYYYQSFSGDIEGINDMEGAKILVSNSRNQLQVGYGANWHNKNFEFGAASNFSLKLIKNSDNFSLARIGRGGSYFTGSMALGLTDCNPCVLKEGDTDGDGICNEDDCAPEDKDLPVQERTPCDDGDATTINDVILAGECDCKGVEKGDITFDCNDDITATAEFGANGITVDYTLPTAFTTCILDGLEVNRTQGLASGLTFPIGTTTVTYLAKDDCGNEKECTFNVTVAERPDPCAGDNSPIVTVETKDPVCDENNGTITFFFEGNSNRTSIAFSLDGGQTYPLLVDDNIGSASFENLAAGNYDLYARWENEECPVALDKVTLNVATHTPGTTCDDKDDETVNDVFLDDGCSCIGEFEEENIIVVDPNACTSRTALNTTLCRGDYEGTLYGGYLLFKDLESHYNLQNGVFVEYKDGTANLTGTWVNIDDPAIVFDIDVKLAGRTISTPPSSPKSHLCLTPNESAFYYYLQTTGTIIGKGKVAGAELTVGRAGPAFQFGIGANPTNSELSYGAAGWITLTIVNQPTTGMALELITNAGGSNGDININLTGDPFTCVENREAISNTCVEDITVDADAGTNGAVVTWNAPTFRSNCIYNSNIDCSEAPSSVVGFDYLGELNGSKYFASTNIATYEEAKSKTIQEGGYLAVICNQAENNFITSKLTSDVAWIGFSDNGTEGTYIWANGADCNYTNWIGSEPNDGHNTSEFTGADHAVIQHNSGGWLDRNGAAKYTYIMEIPCTGAMSIGTANMTQTTGPAPGTVFPVGETTVTYEGVDACGNTVTCNFKVTVEGVAIDASITPNCIDDIRVTATAGTAGKAVTYNTPTFTTTCPSNAGGTDCASVPEQIDGFEYVGEFNGSKYYCSSTDNFTFAQARSLSMANGGHLVEICDQAENDFLARNVGAAEVWIGYTDAAQEGNFTWENDNCSYSNWSSNEPNNSHNSNAFSGADHTILAKNSGVWKDRNGGGKYEFVMEIPCSGNNSGGQQSMVLAQGPASGQVFPIGETTVTYEAMDACGNTTTCSFKVIVDAPANDPCSGNNAPQVTVNATNPDCGQDNGKIRFTFGDHSSRTNIEFSLDGGRTYPLNVSDNVGTASFDNLSEGKYELFARWGNEECPVELLVVRLEENTKTPGARCDDGDDATENDVIQSNGCTCSGERIDDGTCDDLLVNPSFEQYGLSPWRFNSNTRYNKSTRYRMDGNYVVWIYKKYSYQKDAEIYQDAVAIPGAKYSFTFYAGTHRPNYNHEVAIEFYNSYGARLARKAVQIDFDVDRGNYLKEYFLEDTAPSGTTKIRFVGTTSGDYLKLDAICVKVDKSNAQVSGRAGPGVSGGTQEIGEEVFFELDEITLGSSVKKEGIQLDWYSKNSSLPSKYVVEKSVDGKEYIRIQEITDIVDEHLTIMDETPDYGTNSYRVIQEFENGQAVVSNLLPFTRIQQYMT